MENTDLKIKFLEIPVGTRVDVLDKSDIGTSGVLEKIDDDGVYVSWMFTEWQIVNGRSSEQLMKRTQFISFDDIKSYGWITL